jgi:hypothetical protein
MKPVVKIVGADEYGPVLEWTTHWAELVGKTLCLEDANPPTGDAAGKDSVDAALYTMDQMREYADNFHLSRMKVLVAEKEAYERHAPTEPTLDQIRKIEDDFGIVWFVPDDSETFAWRTTNTDEHRKFARAVWKAAISSLTKTADGEKQS